MPFAVKMSPLSSGKGWIVSPSLCLWWSGKDQPSVSVAQGERGRTKSMLDWGELRVPHFLHVSEMNHFTLKRQNQININVSIGKGNFNSMLSLYSVIKLRLQYCRVWITFYVYCAISQQRPDLTHQITGSFPESLGKSDLAVFLLTELQVSAELPLMASKRKKARD